MFSFSPSFDPTEDLKDLSGCVVVVTGANQGLGYSTVKHLARKGAKVYLGSRSEERGKAAVVKLHEEGIRSGEVVYFACDFATPQLAKDAAERILKAESRLDVLVNNAGCIFDYESKPAQGGITEVMMVNHFGTFQFTTTLLPLLKRTAELPESDVRIVTVSSEQHRRALTGEQGKNAFKSFDICRTFYSSTMAPTLSRYAVSKLANVLFSNSLHRQLSGSTRIICLTIHPGVVNTTFTDNLPFAGVFRFLCNILFQGPDTGAYTSCWAAASPLVRADPERYGGAYIAPVCRVVEPAPNAKNEQMQDDLWEMTVRYLQG